MEFGDILSAKRGIMKTNVLLIDDDNELAELLTEYLARFDIQLSVADNGEEGLKLLRQSQPHCVLLDVMLPRADGFVICQEIRKISDIPVIMLTARGELADRIVGHELGADDYLPKPFEPRELAARIQAMLRRIKLVSDGNILRHGDLELDTLHHTATRNGEKLYLTTLEFDALVIFVRHHGVTLSRDMLADLLSDGDWESSSRSLDVLISRLRQKLGDDPQSSKYLKTLRGHGYLFVGIKTDAG